MRCARALLVLLLVCHAQWAAALDFRSVKETGVALYEEPSLSARKLFVVSRYYPVEVMTVQGDWSRVRDATGGIAWIPSAGLSRRHMLLVTAERSEAHAAADAKSARLYTLLRDGVVEMIAPPQAGWVKVHHRDGGDGFVRIDDFWGL